MIGCLHVNLLLLWYYQWGREKDPRILTFVVMLDLVGLVVGTVEKLAFKIPRPILPPALSESKFINICMLLVEPWHERLLRKSRICWTIKSIATKIEESDRKKIKLNLFGEYLEFLKNINRKHKKRLPNVYNSKSI